MTHKSTVALLMALSPATAFAQADPSTDLPPAEAPRPAPRGAVQVELVDSSTGEPIVGATVLLDGEVAGETDATGALDLLDITVGVHGVMIVSATHDAKDAEIVVNAGRTTRLRHRLAPLTAEVYEIETKVARPRREVTEVVLSEAELKTVPGTMGDPVRVVENLPGLNRTPGGLGGALIVRGANPADSGVYIDGVEVPLLYHFGGLTSVINGEFLGGITFMPGGFGAQFGRATAGVVNVETKPLTCDRGRGLVAVDPIDAEMFTCVPLGKWKLAAAGRRSYVDTFLPALLRASAEEGEKPTVVAPAYFDYQVKAERTFARQRFEVFGFGALDTLKVTRAASDDNTDLSVSGGIQFHRLQFRHTYFGDRLTVESALTPGFLRQDFGNRSADLETQHRAGVDIYSLQWRENLSYVVSPYLRLRGGVDHQLYTWNADFITDLPNLARQYPSPLVLDATRQEPWNAGNTDLNQGYWAEIVTNPIEEVTLTPGVRVDRYDFGNTERWSVQPRLSARWQVREPTALKAAAGVYQKLPDIFSGVLAPGFGQPGLSAEKAVHLTSGIEQKWSAVDVTIEGFHVWRSQLPSPTSEVEIRDGKAVPVLFKSDGRGRSYGLELMLKRNPSESRRFNGWVAYTLSRSTRTDRTADPQGFDQYGSVDPGSARLYDLPDASRTYVSPFDQTHILTTVGSWRLPWNMSLGLRFQYVSGNPTTPLENGRAYYDADGDSYKVQPGSVARNSGRLPAFHRLDLRLDKRWDFRAWSLTAYLEVMNAYNRRPVEAFAYDYRYSQRNELRGLPVLPVLGLKGEF